MRHGLCTPVEDVEVGDAILAEEGASHGAMESARTGESRLSHSCRTLLTSTYRLETAVSIETLVRLSRVLTIGVEDTDAEKRRKLRAEQRTLLVVGKFRREHGLYSRRHDARPGIHGPCARTLIYSGSLVKICDPVSRRCSAVD